LAGSIEGTEEPAIGDPNSVHKRIAIKGIVEGKVYQTGAGERRKPCVLASDQGFHKGKEKEWDGTGETLPIGGAKNESRA